ncbi:MAG TPA: helix-turn-helix domain-containing protein [Ktedonobacteraceae bacterium]|jgi:purine catabolism regulator|nr:helix-turn-helix domain-containing protein [Ktedonobacteraceae bacterium]
MMSGSPSPTSSASVRNIQTLLASRDAHLVAGAEGLDRRVTWAMRMRARLPAFESVRGGELALLGLAQLRRLDETLPHLLKSLHRERVAAVAVAASSLEALGAEALATADQLHLPLLLLPQNAPLEEIERDVITFVVSFRGEIERQASEISHQLMQLSIQGAGVDGLCTHLARVCEKWVVLQDTNQDIILQVAPPACEGQTLSGDLSDEALQKEGLARVMLPIQIPQEVVGYVSLIGPASDFDHLERLILGQVTPILSLEFARERERSKVESRYQSEAFMDVVQGNYQQVEEMQVRARLLGHDLSTPQAVVVFELAPDEVAHTPSSPYAQWSKRLSDELLRNWPTAWVIHEPRRVMALLPCSRNGENSEQGPGSSDEQALLNSLERAQVRLQPLHARQKPFYSGGIGRIARDVQAIPQAWREAQQALEIGRRLFGEGKLHSFARLGIYRLLFPLHGEQVLLDFYQETLGPLLDADNRSNQALLETLEGFFRCNGNLSETARSMHLHRNSLLYRLGRIEELLGRSLEDAEHRLALQIALKIRVLLEK